MTTGIDAAVAAIRAGGIAVIPTDTVYGLVCDPASEAAVRRLYASKGRHATQPIALLAYDLDRLLVLLPELRGAAETVLRAMLPGPYTLVLANPAGRFPWLTGGRVGPLGVRVPRLGGPGGAVVGAVGVVAATSANVSGGLDPRRLADVPRTLLDAATVVDGGELPGTPSTVVDLTGPEPVVLREGAVPAAEAVRRARAAATSPADER